MIVCGGMTRQVARYEMAELVYRAEPASPERLALLGGEQRRRFATQQMPGAGPIDKAHRQLERARPMRTPGIRALIQPGQKEAARGFSEARLARQVPCLRQRHQFKVTV